MGLVQREVELAGIATVTLSNIPDLTAAVCVPRIVAIEHPFGLLLGKPGDATGQLSVLRAVLEGAAGMDTPGAILHLPDVWTGPVRDTHPPEPPPIAHYLKRHPWHLPKLFSRDVPESAGSDQAFFQSH